MALRLVANPGKVALTASSLWAVYGAVLILIVDKAPEWLNMPAFQKVMSPEWRDRLLALCLFLAWLFRLIQQQALANATERKLQEERLVRQHLELEATSSTPPLTPNQVKAIKRHAKAVTGSQSPVLKE